jgi:cysteine sulfinate desulfinase/cysteine desulfurase-like protein
LEQLVNTRNKSIQQEIDQEKLSLKAELTQIIRDALLFSKKNNPMTSMLPNSINEIISKVKEDNKALNISVSSINLSQTSKASIRSIQKYESNAFLKALGIDLLNLHPDNININVDKAYEFISKWKTDRNVRQVIRYKVVNEIMSIA